MENTEVKYPGIAIALLSAAILFGVVSATLPEDATIIQPGITLPCRVISVHDGDTLKIECRVEMDIRLLDCWAPEIHGDEKQDGLKSLENLKKIAEGKDGVVTIPLNGPNIGKATSLSRVLGKITIDGKDLSDQQVKGGFAAPTKAGEQSILSK